jgi:integrase
MPKLRLSALALDKLEPPQTGRLELYDYEVPGLTLRVTATGAKSWSLQYRHHGALRRMTLGQYPGLSIKEARERAREARGAVQRGSDPVEEKKAEEREAAESGFASLVDDFVERYAKVHQREWKETERILKKNAATVFGERPVREIRRRDVVDLLDRIYARAPYAANQTRAHLSRMFNWLVEREVLDASPLVGARPRKLAPPRQRVLSDEELAAFWTAAGELGQPYGPALKFMLLTGLRRTNASWLRFDQVNGDWASFTSDEMKGRRPFKCPLSKAAQALVAAQPRLTIVVDGKPTPSPYVFTSEGTHGLSNWSDVKERVAWRMADLLKREVERFTIHDLRRTMSTGLARLHVALEVRDRCTDHKTKGVTAEVYTVFAWDDEALEAVQKWSAHVARVTTNLKVVSPAG